MSDVLRDSQSNAPIFGTLPEEVAERYFANSVFDLHEQSRCRDPAERLELSRVPNERLTLFDVRDCETLKETMFDHSESLERERAAWEYAERLGKEALAAVVEAAERDDDAKTRSSLLWLIQKNSDRASDLLQKALKDSDAEVRDWARMLLREIVGHQRRGGAARVARFDESNPFDQTLPLMIAGYARTIVPGMGWVQATLSPQWFEAIMGRVMACTCARTFEHELIIEKRMKEYHCDKSDHYEIYKFRGITFQPTKYVRHHIYSGIGAHTFYPSGKVEDCSVPPIDDAKASLIRIAETVQIQEPVAIPDTDRTRALAGNIVESVRGRYTGTAYVDVGRLIRQNMKLGPGDVQLTDLHHPFTGPLTNTFLWGTFKGKLSDLNGDGFLDINTERCHSTLDGKLDYLLNGTPNADPYDPCKKT
ncbi:hypothetical protein AB4Z52_12530 [Rhizobium sp. 2YAF20]|uniref:hypothetical protein n=1 Tax=Rhizobium sp. 2YAF20 TaxID=3233027 RepID=UPI003F957154